MAEDYKNAFDYYNADPPREGAAPPPEDAYTSAPQDEYNESITTFVMPRRRAKSIAFMLAVSGLAVSFVVPGVNLLPSAGDLTEESVITETSASGVTESAPSGSEAVTSAPTPTPTTAPTPTPVPLATEDLGLKLDSFKMYPLDKGFLAEVKFTLKTNIGIDVTSVTGALDAKLFRYDGYNFKKKKMKYHYEKFHQDFSMDSSVIVSAESVDSSEKQYTYLFKSAADASSEDKFNVTLRVSNTLNGKSTEDKTVSLNNVAIWNSKTDSYSASLFSVSAKKNSDKTFDISVTPKDGVTCTGISVGSVSIYAKKGTGYLNTNNLKVTISDNNIHVASKKKKVPSKGTFYYTIFVGFEITDSTGTKHTGKSYYNGNKNY